MDEARDLDDQVHLWLVETDGLTDPRLLDAYRRLFSEEEAARYERLRTSRGRHEFLVARALVRTTLARYAPVAPAAWRFHPQPHGRPEIAAPAGLEWLRFNLSHSHGIVVCAVGRGFDLGVDVEQTGRMARPADFAEQRFAPGEAADLRGRTGDDLRRRFFSYWTLKEAYMKARGEGMALGLKNFVFSFTDGGIALALDRGLGDREADWQLALYETSPVHLLALAIRRGAAADRRIVARRVVPLAGEASPADLRLLGATAA